ncbi:hypothetical protein RND71_034306 [Anisodus tanguticus]|uniref:FBD domain-containing protein n=1 Tax=Anisodus tanguticus TaxID=243964 RepID=A0AAE1RBW4_9SOLA|nr:hypothetical protein RND71_034306 [Anisodus tanguticus]
MQTVPKQSVYIKWHPPATNVIKRNVDGAASTNNNKYAFGQNTSKCIRINAPKLRSFDFIGAIQFVSLTNVPLLAKLSLVDIGSSKKAKKHDLDKFFQSFLVLEHLYLDYWSVLVQDKVYLFVALCLIRSSLYLQDIEIEVYHHPGQDELLDPVTGDDVDETSASFSDVTLNHLRTVKFIGITGTKPEMELIKLLLEKSPTLVRMIIEPENGNESCETRIKKRAELTKYM